MPRLPAPSNYEPLYVRTAVLAQIQIIGNEEFFARLKGSKEAVN